MSEALDPEVLAALAQAGMCLRAFRHISNLRSPAYYRATYRIDLTDGRTIKARRLESAAAASEVFRIRRTLPDAFAPALARHGRVLLEEWVPGEELGHASPGPERLAEAATLLAELHARAQLDGQALHQLRSTAAHRDLAVQRLQQLAAAGALEAEMAQHLDQAMRRLDPRQAVFGLVHMDFCGENMVIDRQSRLRVVDNERMGVDALGFDLARTWYRWSLPVAAWEVFQSVYAARLPIADPVLTLPFWRLVAAAGAAAVRLRYNPGRMDEPVQCLHRLAKEVVR